MRLIDGDPLYEKVQHSEELATNRVLDTESTLPYPNNLNPSYIRYVAQMNERTRLKHMIADAPIIEPERQKGKWLANGDIPKECPFCGEDWDKYVFGDIWYTGELPKFCPNCGADMRGEQE